MKNSNKKQIKKKKTFKTKAKNCFFTFLIEPQFSLTPTKPKKFTSILY